MKPLEAIDRLAAWLNRKPTAEEALAERMERQSALDQSMIDLMRIVDTPEFLDACAVFAQLGISAEQLEKIGHAMVHNRILAFGYGDVIDMGQRMAPPGMGTRKTEPYNGELS